MKRFAVISAMLLLLAGVASTVAYRLRFDPLPSDVTADYLVLEKSDRRLILFSNDIPVKEYAVSLGREPIGAKQFEGDGKTPEGQYIIDRRKADSSFHLALHVSYPNVQVEQFAASRGRSPGGAIMIHGIRNGLGFLGPLHRLHDWTDGCVAVTDAEIEELWRAVPDGTPIEIRP
jgi:murein L,D-transpeptidase YafK